MSSMKLGGSHPLRRVGVMLAILVTLIAGSAWLTVSVERSAALLGAPAPTGASAVGTTRAGGV